MNVGVWQSFLRNTGWAVTWMVDKLAGKKEHKVEIRMGQNTSQQGMPWWGSKDFCVWRMKSKNKASGLVSPVL